MNVRRYSQGRSAPADLKKDANGFDLPITLRLLFGSGQAEFEGLRIFLVLGETPKLDQTPPIKAK